MVLASQRAASLLRGLAARASSSASTATGLAGPALPLGCALEGLGGLPHITGAATGAWPAAASRRCFSAWEGAWTAPRQHVYSDVATARTMLPHRTNFVPQFHAHGFQLIPESLLSPLAALQQVGAAPGGGGAATASTAAAVQQQQQQQWRARAAAAGGGPLAGGDVLYADSVKRKRKLKMKKHKYKKRMRLLKKDK